jgi:hypothetical protein
MLTPQISEEMILSEHFYNSVEDPNSIVRGLVLVPLFVVALLLPFAVFDELIFMCVSFALLIALVAFGSSWVMRRLRLREALRILVWLRSMPFKIEGYLDALNYEPLRDRYFYLRVELKPLAEDKLPSPEMLDRFIQSRLRTVRIRYQLGENLVILLTSARLSTREGDDSLQRNNLDCHRWLRSCLGDVLSPLHERYSIRRVLVYHQNA